MDPFVALWMVAHASGENPTAHDGEDGALFGIRKPTRQLASLDARPYWSHGNEPDIAREVSSAVHWYRAPDISERLRIQRGSFILGPLSSSDQVTMPLRWRSTPATEWLQDRYRARGQPGRPNSPLTDVIVFRVSAGMKSTVREWLQDRAGLTQSVIYPTPWHRPFLEEFCRSYGRQRPWDFT